MQQKLLTSIKIWVVIWHMDKIKWYVQKSWCWFRTRVCFWPWSTNVFLCAHVFKRCKFWRRQSKDITCNNIIKNDYSNASYFILLHQRLQWLSLHSIDWNGNIAHNLMSLPFQAVFLYFDILKNISNEKKYINSDIFENKKMILYINLFC